MFRPQNKPTRKEICPECRGTGKVMDNGVWSWGWKTCRACNGTGWIEIPVIPTMRPNQRKPFSLR